MITPNYLYIHFNSHHDMGLDLRPMGKPKPGFEERFYRIFRILQGLETPKLSFFEKLQGKKLQTQDELLQEWVEIQIPAYETIKAPRVGRDKEADDWIHLKYRESNRAQSEAMFTLEYAGFYVIELAKEINGVPMYISEGQDRNVFRGQFLNDCVELIGEDLVNEAWGTKLAPVALDYGNRLMHVADKIAKENDLEYLKTQRIPPDKDEDSIESRLHIIFSLAKWLTFYGKNGHGYEADY